MPLSDMALSDWAVSTALGDNRQSKVSDVRGPNHKIAPICQGTNSLSPKPSNSLCVFLPEAVSSIF